MPVVGSTYWNMVYGRVPGEAEQDLEGMQTMQNLAKNMAWMMKCFELGRKNGIALPDTSAVVIIKGLNCLVAIQPFYYSLTLSSLNATAAAAPTLSESTP